MSSGANWFPTTHADWARCDAYSNAHLLAPDPVLDAVVRNCKARDLPWIQVSPAQGKFLKLIVQTSGAKRILEVGLLGGYSAIWMARGLPTDGHITSLELNPHHASVAQENLASAGFADKVKIVVGPAADSLAALPATEKFDLAFIDADSKSAAIYMKEARRLVRSGGVIMVDNAVGYGKISDPSQKDEYSEGMRDVYRMLKDDREIDATTVVTAGEKGLDGFIYAIRK